MRDTAGNRRRSVMTSMAARQPARPLRKTLVTAILVTVASFTHHAPAAADLTGLPNFVWGATLVPDPPIGGQPVTVQVYGVYPTGCGEITVDPDHHAIHLRSTACVDTSSGQHWVATFPLGVLAAGSYRLEIPVTLDRPDSASSTWYGSLTFEVVGGGSPPPPPDTLPPPPGPPPPPDTLPPPPPPPHSSLLEWTATDPYAPTPDGPMALLVGGETPYGCPVVSAASVVDTSHLTITLSPSIACPGDSALRAWSHRFDLGLQREGWHTMSLTIRLEGPEPATLTTPVQFLVYHDTTGFGPPPDSLTDALSANRPNPFAQVTRFSVSTDTPQDAEVGVFDLQGRRVSRVFHGRLPAGTTQLAWNGFRDDGTRAVAGVYFYRLEMRGRVVSRRLVLLGKR